MLIFERNKFCMFRYFLVLISMLSFHFGYAQKKTDTAFEAYKQQYKDDLFSVIKKDTTFISFYKFNPKMVVTAQVVILENEPVFQFTTHSGKTKDAQKYAQVSFSLNGKSFKIFAYQLLKLKNKAETADDIFIPFTDVTNGHDTYGGGRYLDFKTGDIKNNTLVIDFNKAYNPYCAFVTGYNCPIPTRENDIPVLIKAGEKYRPEKFKHDGN
jgi:uncharacterized protein (DUF1684 family)